MEVLGWFPSERAFEDALLADPEYGPELRRVFDAGGMGSGSLGRYRVWERFARKLLAQRDAERVADGGAAGGAVNEMVAARQPRKRGAKQRGIPERETFWIVDRRIEDPERWSRRKLADETHARSDLTGIPRDRLSPLVDWVDSHPARARWMSDRRKIPPEFRATRKGWLPPEPDSPHQP